MHSSWWVLLSQSLSFAILNCIFPCSAASECPFFNQCLLLFWLISLSALSREYVPISFSHTFTILTCLSYAIQEVSAPHLLGCFYCPNLSPLLLLCSPVSECPSLTHLFLWASWLVPLSTHSRKWVPLIHSLPFISLTWPSMLFRRWVHFSCLLLLLICPSLSAF